MAARLLTSLIAGFYLTKYSNGLDKQNDIILTIPQAQELWDNRDILGNSTTWNHPLDSGTCEYDGYIAVILLLFMYISTKHSCNRQK